MRPGVQALHVVCIAESEIVFSQSFCVQAFFGRLGMMTYMTMRMGIGSYEDHWHIF
jgi:hypothetical protein